MEIQPYLQFNGRCEEAVEFYQNALGAQVTMMMRFSKMPSSENPVIAPGMENKIMHLSLQLGDTTVLMSDGMGSGETKFEGFSLRLGVPDKAEAERLFMGLCEGGQVVMPLTSTFWSAYFGMVTDRFGLTWMIDAS